MTASNLILLGIAALLMAYLLLVLIVYAVGPARRVGGRIREAFTAPFAMKFDEFDREGRQQRLRDEVRRALGLTDPWGSQERADILDAAVAAQEITVLNQLLRKSVTHCLRTHWAVAQGLGATDMSEAARHPLCRHLRQRVIDLSELLSESLARYPLILNAPELIRLQLGVSRLGLSCINCPYFAATVADAPRICPTAQAIGQRTSTGARVDDVVDGEVVDVCGEPQ